MIIQRFLLKHLEGIFKVVILEISVLVDVVTAEWFNTTTNTPWPAGLKHNRRAGGVSVYRAAKQTQCFNKQFSSLGSVKFVALLSSWSAL